MLETQTPASEGCDIPEAQKSMPYFAPGNLEPGQFASLRNALLLSSCKWDPQVEDVSTLADFPLVLRNDHWRKLSQWAESLSHEIFRAEREIVRKPQLLKALGMPRELRVLLSCANEVPITRAAVRALRFDFHFTTEGWKVSEVNSDVPGGFCEASAYTRLMVAHFSQWRTGGDPGALWAKAVAAASDCGTIALLSAPGLMEDRQVIAYLASCLRKEGCRTHLANPNQIRWQKGRARLQSSWSQAPLDALVRFCQAEWMPAMLKDCSWREYFVGGLTPIANPGTAAISESKRLPLVWQDLECPMTTWRTLLPETRHPREVNWRNSDHWVLKSAYSNTGDTVSIRRFMAAREWKQLEREMWFRPGTWVAQRRFEPVPIETSRGKLYPCLGVYTINGKAAGIYGRLGIRPWIDFSAIDVTVLLEPETA